MTRLGGIKHQPGGGGNGGVSGRSSGGRQQIVQVKDLPLEQQRAFEIIDSLRKEGELEMRARIIDAAETKEPVGPAGLKLIADLYDALDMPLDAQGVARFKLERHLVGGTTLAGETAKAYARALDGEEILIRVTRLEERNLRPSEADVLRFLREMAAHSNASELAPVKRALGLGNPPRSETAELLENEVVGLNTVEEISRATTMREIPVTRSGMRRLVAELLAEAGED